MNHICICSCRSYR